MDIGAGQESFRDSVAPWGGTNGGSSGAPAGVAGGLDLEMDPTEEAAFWAALARDYPTEFGGVDAAALALEAPSGELVTMLLGVQVDDENLVDDQGVLEVVAAWQRVASMAHAGAARAAAALSRRACMNVPGEPVPLGRGVRRLTVLRATGTEIAIRTGCSVRAGEILARDGRLFDGPLADTGDALARGHIDPATARQIADRLAEATLPLALAVQDAVLPDAGRRSPTQVDRDLTRALIEADPHDADHRHTRARQTRRVCHPRLLPDGMAGIWAVLPAPDATVLDLTLESAARTARAEGDPRTLDQLRADGLIDLLTAPDRGVRRRPVADGSAAGRAGEGGTTEGGSIEDGSVTGGSVTGGSATGRSARGRAADGGATQGQTAQSQATAGGTAGDWFPAGRSTTVRVDVTVPLSTLLGVDDAPGDLAGYGAITATQARALAAGGIWRRLVTDPLSGTVLDVGRTRYRPPAGLREHVVARDRSCARPGCSVPASRAELDHTIPFHGTRAGPTAHDNLAPLCAADHTAKTLGLLRLEQPEPGVLLWTTATGQRIRVIPGRDGEATPQAPAPRTGERRPTTSLPPPPF